MSHEGVPTPEYSALAQWLGRVRDRLSCCVTRAGLFACLIAAIAGCGSGEVEVLTESPSPFDEAIASDPWGVAASQRQLAAEAWADGNPSAAVIHAYQATMAAFETIPEEGIIYRDERGVTRSEDETDIWEYSRTMAAVADASMTWASVQNGIRPDDHADNYDRASAARTDVRNARRGAGDAWEITNMYWDESRGSDTEEAWADAALAWAHVADAWAYANDSVDGFFDEALTALWNSR